MGNYPHNWSIKVSEDQYNCFWFNEEQMIQFDDHFMDEIPSSGWSYKEPVNSKVDWVANSLFINASDCFKPSEYVY